MYGYEHFSLFEKRQQDSGIFVGNVVLTFSYFCHEVKRIGVNRVYIYSSKSYKEKQSFHSVQNIYLFYSWKTEYGLLFVQDRYPKYADLVLQRYEDRMNK
jgi:hypothetical protein